MKEADILAIARFAASLGFKAGFAEATDCINALTEQAHNPEAQRIARFMAMGLDQFAGKAHDAFMADGLQLKVVFDADGTATIQ